MATAYDAIIATIVVASDASSVTKAMVLSTQWRAGTSGTWLSTDCTLSAGNTYQFRTENVNFINQYTAILPNIKADVTVDWDTSGTEITTIGDYFMSYYAHNCSSLTSLSVQNISSLTSVGSSFMSLYAYGCSSLTSLSVPDTSSITSVGSYFMRYYAYGCTSLTSLSVPDTSSLTSIVNYFMHNYAYGCTALLRLELPKAGWFKTHNTNWYVPSARLTYLKGYVNDEADLQDWKDLTVSGKTLYTNYIQSSDNVIYEAPVTFIPQMILT